MAMQSYPPYVCWPFAQLPFGGYPFRKPIKKLAVLPNESLREFHVNTPTQPVQLQQE